MGAAMGALSLKSLKGKGSAKEPAGGGDLGPLPPKDVGEPGPKVPVHHQESTHRRSEEGHGGEKKKETGVAADRLKFHHPAVLARMKSVEDEQSSDIRRFQAWLRENDATFPDLQFKCYSKNVRGVHAKRSIPPYQQVMAIPLKCVITDDTGRQTPMGKRLELVAHQLTVPNHCQVIVYMMMTEANGDSFFEPYYSTLPKSYDNFPIFWSELDLKKLDGSDLVRQIRERKRNIRSDYDTICECLPEFKKKFCFDDFLLWRTAVGSRNFSIVISGEKRTAMVPMADMLNHYRPRETSWTYDNGQGCFTMTSLKCLAQGHQVMDSYGKKCNSKFLLHYGFTIECNRESDGKCQNEVDIGLGLDKSEALFLDKSAMVSKSRNFRLSMNHEDRSTTEAFTYMRVVAATKAELALLDRGYSQQVHCLSAANEYAVIAAIARFCKAKLTTYPTKIEHDNHRLETEKLDPFGNEKHMLIVLRGEKQILTFYINLAEEIKPVLELPPRERNILVREKYNEPDDVGRFITAVNRALMAQERLQTAKGR